jgi:hypothetical protein
MPQAMIAPQGLIRGTVTAGTLHLRRYEALTWLDGWVHHFSRDNSDPAKPWYRMHDKDDKGVSEADFPAPLVVGDKLGIYKVPGYEALIVRNGEMFRYSHDNIKWSQTSPHPLLKDVIGAPTLFRADDPVFGILRTTIQAMIPTRRGLIHFGYAPEWDLWLPRNIIIREETGWPTGYADTRGGYQVFFEIAGKLRSFSIGTDPLFLGTNEFPNNIVAPDGAATGIQGWPSIDLDGPFPTLFHDDYQILVPRREKNKEGFNSLIHYWVSAQQYNPVWNSAVIPGIYSGSAALMTTGLRTILREDQRHKESDDYMLALAPNGADIYSITRNGQTAQWSEPVKVI